MFQRPDSEVQTGFADPRAITDCDNLRQPLILDQPGQTFPRTFGIRGNNHRANLHPLLNMIRQRFEKAHIFQLPFGRKIAPDPSACVNHPRSSGLGQRMELDHPVACDRGLPCGIIKIQKPRRHRFIDRIHPPLLGHRDLARLILVSDAIPTRQTGGRHLIVQRDRCARQIVKQGFQLFVEERQPMLQPLIFPPGRDRFVKRVIGSGSAKFNSVVLAEPGNRRLVKDHFGHRRQLDQVQLLGGALRGGIKPTRAIQDIPKKIKPNGTSLPRRKDVNDAAPNREIAGLHDSRALGETHTCQIVTQRSFINPMIHLRSECRVAQHLPGGHALGGGIKRGQQNELTRHLMHQRCKRRHPRRRDIRIGRNAIIRQTIPTGEGNHRHVGRKKRQRRTHRLHPLVVSRHMDHRPAGFSEFFQDQLGIKPFRGAACNDRLLRHATSLSLPVQGRTPHHAIWMSPALCRSAKKADLQVLIHAPKGCHENRQHPDQLDKQPGQAQLPRECLTFQPIAIDASGRGPVN